MGYLRITVMKSEEEGHHTLGPHEADDMKFTKLDHRCSASVVLLPVNGSHGQRRRRL